MNHPNVSFEMLFLTFILSDSSMRLQVSCLRMNICALTTGPRCWYVWTTSLLRCHLVTRIARVLLLQLHNGEYVEGDWACTTYRMVFKCDGKSLARLRKNVLAHLPPTYFTVPVTTIQS